MVTEGNFGILIQCFSNFTAIIFLINIQYKCITLVLTVTIGYTFHIKEDTLAHDVWKTVYKQNVSNLLFVWNALYIVNPDD